MAKKANDNPNEPDADDVRGAVINIEQRYTELASERGSYMLKCRRIREAMAGDYEHAVNRGISKKLLKTIIKERELERRIENLAVDLEPDERSELEMLVEKLGDFGSLPLGQAAISRAEGGTDALKRMGA
jgi:hypothetical protein